MCVLTGPVLSNCKRYKISWVRLVATYPSSLYNTAVSTLHRMNFVRFEFPITLQFHCRISLLSVWRTERVLLIYLQRLRQYGDNMRLSTSTPHEMFTINESVPFTEKYKRRLWKKLVIRCCGFGVEWRVFVVVNFFSLCRGTLPVVIDSECSLFNSGLSLQLNHATQATSYYSPGSHDTNKSGCGYWYWALVYSFTVKNCTK